MGERFDVGEAEAWPAGTYGTWPAGVKHFVYVKGETGRKRKAALETLARGLPGVVYSGHVEDAGVAFYEAAKARGLEGVIAKGGASRYQAGVRSPDWLKVKTRKRQEAVIAGFTDPRGGRQHLGALVLGVYRGDELVYIGHTGGGLDARSRADPRGRLDRLGDLWGAVLGRGVDLARTPGKLSPEAR